MRYLYVYGWDFRKQYVSNNFPEQMAAEDVRKVAERKYGRGGTLYTCVEVPEVSDAALPRAVENDGDVPRLELDTPELRGVDVSLLTKATPTQGVSQGPCD